MFGDARRGGKVGLRMSDTSQGPGWWQASDGKWYPPEQHERARGPGGLAPLAVRRQLLTKLEGHRKFSAPFKSGDLAAVNILGGNWNEYAGVVLDMLIADTLLNIEEQLAGLGRKVAGGT